jgi:RimJ/RimL family protein N-acetyltransferase
MKIRPATLEDADRLFRWRNDPATRAASVQYDLVDCVQHHQWLVDRLSLEHPHLYIAEVDHIPVGTFRIDDDKISYTIASELKGRGFATEMLRMAHIEFGSLTAEIYPDNVASIKVALKSGMNVVILSRKPENEKEDRHPRARKHRQQAFK